MTAKIHQTAVTTAADVVWDEACAHLRTSFAAISSSMPAGSAAELDQVLQAAPLSLRVLLLCMLAEIKNKG